MKFTLLLFLTFFPAAVFAQIINKPGELTLANGDVKTGFVSYFYDKPSEVIFSSEYGAKNVFQAKEIQGIKLENGERFVSKFYKTQGDSTFLVLKLIIESPKISLYVREDDATEYFYVSKDDALHRLENNKVYEKRGDKQYVRKDNQYVAILGALMADRVDIVAELDKVSLHEHSLAKVISKYNQGEATYHLLPGGKAEKESNWVLFTQYSQYGVPKEFARSARAFGNMVGLQYYFSQTSRHSLKVSADYINSVFNDESAVVYGLGLRYEWAFKKAESYTVYFQMHVAELGYVEYSNSRNRLNRNGFTTSLMLSPGIGFEYKPLPRVAVYGEVNNLLQLYNIPKSFSLGLKYDFGKTNWSAY